MLSSIGTWFVGLLNSTQLQSIGRTALKVGGALLIAKYGVDPSNVASVVGGIAAAAGVISSVKAHASTPAISTSDLVSAAVTAAVQSVVNATPVAATTTAFNTTVASANPTQPAAA